MAQLLRPESSRVRSPLTALPGSAVPAVPGPRAARKAHEVIVLLAEDPHFGAMVVEGVDKILEVLRFGRSSLILLTRVVVLVQLQRVRIPQRA